MKTKLLICGVTLSLLTQLATAQQRRSSSGYPPNFPNAKAEVYKTVGEVELKIYIFNPPDHKPADRRPAIVFFFGGGFRGGSPRQFARHCEYFALRGIVAMTADYRVRNRHGTTPADSIQDGKSAIRWVRANAARLGVDPDRIVASGGSAGGLIAACVGVIPNLDREGEDDSVSYIANAMVLFNPAIMGKRGLSRPSSSGRPSFTEDIMPFYHVHEGLPPSIMFFGTDDRLLAGAKEFHEAARSKGNRCELLTWEGLGHGFFNLGQNKGKEFIETVKAADKFLASLGYLQGEPTIDRFMKRAN